MQIRPLRTADLDLIDEIDATVDSIRYHHVERVVDQSADGDRVRFAIEDRPLPVKRVESNPIGDDLRFSLKQTAADIEEGLALMAEHEEVPIASLLARVALDDLTLVEIVDVRVDFDHRRQGLGSAMLFQAINFAREKEARAIRVATKSSNAAANALFAKLGFELAGVDTFRSTNHDLVKEQTTLIWYLALQ
jgi:ribosomal protein S18 acetylase RimI-like enzyme